MSLIYETESIKKNKEPNQTKRRVKSEFSKIEMQMAKNVKERKKSSTSLTIREMNIKTILKMSLMDSEWSK